jgi:hypothetical protein
MHALSWDPASFDVVTSFRGIWGTTPEAVAEILDQQAAIECGRLNFGTLLTGQG